MRQFQSLQLKTASAIWLRTVKSARRLVGLLSRATPLIVGSSALSWVKASFYFSSFVTKTIKNQGHRGLAIYLKACNVLLMQSVSGQKISNPRDLGVAVARTGKGLPRVIPVGYRLRINQGDRGVIRLYLGFFSLYRVLDYRGKLSLRSVIEPGKELKPDFLREWRRFSAMFVNSLLEFGVKPFRIDLVPASCPKYLAKHVSTVARKSDMVYSSFVSKREYRAELWGYVVKFFPLLKSGPNSSDGRLNSACLIDDWIAWVSRPEFFKVLVSFVALTRAWSLLPEVIFRSIDQMLTRIPAWQDRVGHLGALAAIDEPGKVRIVAMVDSLTQWLLHPLHKYIFRSILRVIPQDGTFDQMKPIKSLVESKMKDKDRRLFSFDLSAATDRIPVVIQEVLLGAFTTDEFASLWRRLLTERLYRVPSLLVKTYGVKNLLRNGYVLSKGTQGVVCAKYAVGQPMGAYSSWAMLALVHHAMVQFSAFKAGIRGWFSAYAVLGDDVVIGDYRVAKEYTVLCDTLGVQIGLHKSIISTNGSAEFAKRFFFKGSQAMPVPLIGIAVGWLGLREVPELVRMVLDRTGKGLSWFQILRFLGYGFRTASKASNSKLSRLRRRVQSAVLLETRPGAVHGAPDLASWYLQTRANTYLGVSGVGQGILDSFHARVTWFKSLNLRRRLFKALIGFNLSELWSQETLFGVNEWWELNIVNSIKRPILQHLEEVEQKLGEIPSGSEAYSQELAALLEDMEDLETQVSMIPTKLVVMRSVKETLRLRTNRFPKRVRMWRKVSRVLRRPLERVGT